MDENRPKKSTHEDDVRAVLEREKAAAAFNNELQLDTLRFIDTKGNLNVIKESYESLKAKNLRLLAERAEIERKINLHNPTVTEERIASYVANVRNGIKVAFKTRYNYTQDEVKYVSDCIDRTMEELRANLVTYQAKRAEFAERKKSEQDGDEYDKLEEEAVKKHSEVVDVSNKRGYQIAVKEGLENALKEWNSEIDESKKEIVEAEGAHRSYQTELEGALKDLMKACELMGMQAEKVSRKIEERKVEMEQDDAKKAFWIEKRQNLAMVVEDVIGKALVEIQVLNENKKKFLSNLRIIRERTMQLLETYYYAEGYERKVVFHDLKGIIQKMIGEISDYWKEGCVMLMEADEEDTGWGIFSLFKKAYDECEAELAESNEELLEIESLERDELKLSLEQLEKQLIVRKMEMQDKIVEKERIMAKVVEDKGEVEKMMARLENAKSAYTTAKEKKANYAAKLDESKKGLELMVGKLQERLRIREAEKKVANEEAAREDVAKRAMSAENGTGKTGKATAAARKEAGIAAKARAAAARKEAEKAAKARKEAERAAKARKEAEKVAKATAARKEAAAQAEDAEGKGSSSLMGTAVRESTNITTPQFYGKSLSACVTLLESIEDLSQVPASKDEDTGGNTSITKAQENPPMTPKMRGTPATAMTPKMKGTPATAMTPKMRGTPATAITPNKAVNSPVMFRRLENPAITPKAKENSTTMEVTRVATIEKIKNTSPANVPVEVGNVSKNNFPANPSAADEEKLGRGGFRFTTFGAPLSVTMDSPSNSEYGIPKRKVKSMKIVKPAKMARTGRRGRGGRGRGHGRNCYRGRNVKNMLPPIDVTSSNNSRGSFFDYGYDQTGEKMKDITSDIATTDGKKTEAARLDTEEESRIAQNARSVNSGGMSITSSPKLFSMKKKSDRVNLTEVTEL